MKVPGLVMERRAQPGTAQPRVRFLTIQRLTVIVRRTINEFNCGESLG